MLSSPAGTATVETLDELYAAIEPLSMDAGWRRTPGARASGTFEPDLPRSVIDGRVFAWERGDIVAAPSGKSQYHEPDGDAVLFCVSDEPLLERVGLLRTVSEEKSIG
jgi:hypothetical protein